MCSPCLPSTGVIGTLGAQFLSVNKDSHQLLQGGCLFYKGWSAWNLLFFVGGISSLDHEACQIHWMYYGTFLLPTLLPSSEPSLTDILACVWFVAFLSPRFFKKASGILQSPPSIRPSVCPSVRHAISSLTIGRNSNKFGV